MSRLQFYPKSHRYKLDGQWVPGVTTMMKGVPKEALPYWSARYVAEWVADHQDEVTTLWSGGRAPMVGFLKELPWEKRDTAATRGNMVHAITARLLGTGGSEEVDDAVAGYVEAAMSFAADWGLVAEHCEVPGYHQDLLYAGTIDVIGRLTRGPNLGDNSVVLDWKTSESGIWPETGLQLAGYRGFTHIQVTPNTEDHVELEQPLDAPMPPTTHGVAVHLTPTGYEAFEVASGPDVLKKLRHARVIKEMVDDMKKRKDAWVRELGGTS